MENPFSLDNYNDATDEQLVTLSLKGDKKSLNKLLKRNQGYIFNICLRMLSSVPEAEDATQEILIKTVTALSTYDSSKARFRTWLYKVAFNHVLKQKKGAMEKQVVSFSKSFESLANIPDTTEEENTLMDEPVKEMKAYCTAGMLMCLSREQRLIYIVGEIFRINHNLAAEFFDITPANFRKKLSRVRADLHQWMHKKCGLVNKSNPCRCRKKTKEYIKRGYVDPNNYTWRSNYTQTICEVIDEKLDDIAATTDDIYASIHRDTPFKNNLKADVIYDEILNRKDFTEFYRVSGNQA